MGWSGTRGCSYYDAWVIPKGAPHQENASASSSSAAAGRAGGISSRPIQVGPVVPEAYERCHPRSLRTRSERAREPGQQVQVDRWWTTKNDEGKTNLEVVYDTWASGT